VRDFLAFLGITDVEFVYAEGLAISEGEQDRVAGEGARVASSSWFPLTPEENCHDHQKDPASQSGHARLRRRGREADPQPRQRQSPARGSVPDARRLLVREPDDYVAGFPSHPHRGFETVTYLLDGHMLHEDHLGNSGNLKSGGVQWMTAGRGIIHSEMPQQENGRMRGFQLWINLPAKEKMKPAGYRDIQADEIPKRLSLPGQREGIIAGITEARWRRARGSPSRSIGTSFSEAKENSKRKFPRPCRLPVSRSKAAIESRTAC
jgi:hypothetical protein